MKDTHSSHDVSAEALLGRVADEFTDRLHRGENPEIEEYANRYPEIAAVINQVFPALREIPDADGTGASTAGDSHIPNQLGDYRIIRQIARGGMGVVYEAAQISLDRRVALKVLPFAAVLDQKQLQRFKNESHAAAQLHHTNIVPVFSVGCERGVYYYAMQHIDGQPLSTVIAELRQQAGLACASNTDFSMSDIADSLARGQWHNSREQHHATAVRHSSTDSVTDDAIPTHTAKGIATSTVFFQSVAQLGVQAAEALHHAHERGVIHRDIKPANLLLDKEGHLWVTDFGLASMQTDSSLTVSGDLLGTLRYMSPEQAMAKRTPLDERTDLYSLGITLYELVTLRPAFEGRDRQELLWEIATSEPPPLRQLNPAAPRELAIIVTKAISKDPADRYASAKELADDLTRFLANRPILAQPPTMLDRATKWARRHRSAVLIAASLLIVSLLALSASTVLVLRERAEAIRQRDAARSQQLIAEKQRARAEANLQLARDSVDRMLTRVAAEELGDEQHTEKIRRAFLEDSLAFHKQLLQERSADTTARRDSGYAYRRVADINALLRRDAEAAQAYKDAINTFADLCKEFPEEDSYASQLAGCYASLATLCWERGHYEQAKPSATAAIDILQTLTSKAPDTVEHRVELARASNLRGLVLRDAGNFEEAELSFRQAIQLRESLGKDLPESSEHQLELSRALRNLAALLVKQERIEDAEPVIHEVFQLQENLIARFPDKLNFGAELAHTHRWWDETRRSSRSSDSIQQALDRPTTPPAEEEAVAELPEVPWYSERLTDSYQKLDNALLKAGQPKEAAEAHQQAVELQEKLIDKYPNLPEYRLGLADLHLARAQSLKTAARLTEAVCAYRDGITVLQDLAGDFPDDTLYSERLFDASHNLHQALDNLDVSELIYLNDITSSGVVEAVKLARSTDDTNGPAAPFTSLSLAEYLILGGDYERASVTLQKAIREEAAGDSHFKTLGIALLGCGRQLEAYVSFRNVLSHAAGFENTDIQSSDPEAWTAAYFLDTVTATRFTEYWAETVIEDIHYAPLPWFYVGLTNGTGKQTEFSHCSIPKMRGT